MKAYIHIGTHKTGTTAIQSFCRRERDWLAERGLGYRFEGERVRSCHIGMVEDLCGRDEKAGLDALRGAQDWANKTGGDLFFSAEALFRLDEAQSARVIDSFRRELPGADFVIVCVLRPQLDFADSLYRSQYKKYRRPPMDFADWLAARRHILNYGTIIERYADGLSAARMILPYAGRSNWIATFFAHLGIDASDREIPHDRKNISLDTVDCLAKRMVMAPGPDPELSDAFNAFCWGEPLKTEYSFLDRKDRDDLIAYLSAGNRDLVGRSDALDAMFGPGAFSFAKIPVDRAAVELALARANAFFGRRRE